MNPATVVKANSDFVPAMEYLQGVGSEMIGGIADLQGYDSKIISAVAGMKMCGSKIIGGIVQAKACNSKINGGITPAKICAEKIHRPAQGRKWPLQKFNHHFTRENALCKNSAAFSQVKMHGAKFQGFFHACYTTFQKFSIVFTRVKVWCRTSLSAFTCESKVFKFYGLVFSRENGFGKNSEPTIALIINQLGSNHTK